MNGVPNKKLKELRQSTCWEWPYHLGHGYGIVMTGGVRKRVHRAVYEALIGSIPQGLVIDHLCRNKKCCNPYHLEPVTHVENTLRGNAIPAQNRRKKICKRGHLLEGDNVSFNKRNHRSCVTCCRARDKMRSKKLWQEHKRKKALALKNN